MKLILCILSVVRVSIALQNLNIVYQWRYIDYLWNSKEHKENYVKNGDYDHTKIMAIDVDRAKGRLLITSYHFA